MLQALLLRFMPYLNVTEHRNQLEELWNVIFRGLAVIGRRDSHLLISFYSEFQRWFTIVQDFSTILGLARSLSDSANHPMKNNSLAFALTNKVRLKCYYVFAAFTLSVFPQVTLNFIQRFYCPVWRIRHSIDVGARRKLISYG